MTDSFTVYPIEGQEVKIIYKQGDIAIWMRKQTKTQLVLEVAPRKSRK